MHENKAESFNKPMTQSRPINDEYAVDTDAVAEAILRRVCELAVERAQRRRALIRSIEMIVPGDIDGPAVVV